MKVVRLLLLLIIQCSVGFSGEIHCKHFFHGMPLGSPESNDLIIRDCYALSNNKSTDLADWVAYKLTGSEIQPILDLERKWRTDPWLSEDETLEPTPKSKDDYKGVGAVKIDRGHLAPLASFKGSLHASQVNFYSNIAPQKSNLNKGPWLMLEEKVRSVVREHGTAWVVCGPLYEYEDGEEEFLPNATEENPVLIPSGFWKIVAIQPSASDKSISVSGFIFDQDVDRSSNFTNHVVKISEIESKTDLQFFSQFEVEIQTDLKSSVDVQWMFD